MEQTRQGTPAIETTIATRFLGDAVAVAVAVQCPGTKDVTTIHITSCTADE